MHKRRGSPAAALYHGPLGTDDARRKFLEMQLHQIEISEMEQLLRGQFRFLLEDYGPCIEAEDAFTAKERAVKVHKVFARLYAGKPIDHSPPDQFAEPRRLAKDMGPISRKIVEAICERGGSIPLAELADVLDWNGASKDATFQGRKTAINKKLKGTPWKLERQSNEARLARIGKNPLNGN